MTTVIGIQYDDKVVIAADSRTSDSNGQIWKTTAKVGVNGSFLLAGAGDCFPLDIAQYLWKTPIPTIKDYKDPIRYMVSIVIPSLRKAMEANGYTKDPNDKDAGFDILISFGGNLFIAGDGWDVNIPNHNIASIGSGGAYAHGALSAGASIEDAMKIAEENDNNSGGPFIILEQKKAGK
jgi:ATP-dependent protease HslVU (ClpYQ) peptidase subunit